MTKSSQEYLCPYYKFLNLKYVQEIPCTFKEFPCAFQECLSFPVIPQSCIPFQELLQLETFQKFPIAFHQVLTDFQELPFMNNDSNILVITGIFFYPEPFYKFLIIFQFLSPNFFQDFLVISKNFSLLARNSVQDYSRSSPVLFRNFSSQNLSRNCTLLSRNLPLLSSNYKFQKLSKYC